MIRQLLLIAVLLAQQTYSEPPAYPEGVFCTPHGDLAFGVQTTDHPCSCKNMQFQRSNDAECCVRAPNTNDASCKQWCNEQHCACPVACVDPANETPEE